LEEKEMTTGIQQDAQPGRVDSHPARRVLLVEDHDTVRKVLRCTLEEGGYQVIEARNGVEALTLCRLEKPDLVVTDLIMPNKDGLETIAELRQVASHLPVIAMTGGGHVGASLYLAVAETLGAALVLEKPFTGPILLEAVTTLLASPPPTPEGASQPEQHAPPNN
jgi:CheY-like chemotaxis protein